MPTVDRMATNTRMRNEASGGRLPWRTVDLTLRVTRSGWLSTTRPDGRPHAAPVWFVWAEGTVYFTTAATSQKGVNLNSQPYAVLQVGDGDDVIIVEGRTRLVRIQRSSGRRRFDTARSTSSRSPVNARSWTGPAPPSTGSTRTG